jgi:hypothetical protein
MALWLKGPERGRRVDAHTTKCTVYIGASSLDDYSAQVFPYNVFAYCSICRVDCKFARNKKKMIRLLWMSYDCGLIVVGRPLWQEDGLIFTTAAGPNQHNHSRVLFWRDPWPYLTCSDSRIPQTLRLGSCVYMPQEHGRIVTSPHCAISYLPSRTYMARYSNRPLYYRPLYDRLPLTRGLATALHKTV